MNDNQEEFRFNCSEYGLYGMLRYYPETDEFCFHDQFGHLLTHQQTAIVITGLLNHLAKSSEADIEEHNRENSLEWEKEQWKQSCRKKPLQANIPSRRGYIYFVQDGEGRVKIGKTINMSKRIREYTKLPTEPIILHTFESENYSDAEILVHNRYADQRLRGEWFDLTKEDIEFIKSGDLEKIVISLLNG